MNLSYVGTGINIGASLPKASLFGAVTLRYNVPYRLDITRPPSDTLDFLIELGALDIETAGAAIAAILPDSVRLETVTSGLGKANLTVSTAVARDDGSVWMLSPRAVRIGGLLVTPTNVADSRNTLLLTDSFAFGTGHHITTALCVEALAEILALERFDCILDVGTGSGILALAALKMGVPQAVGLDIDAQAVKAAAENARLNQVEDRFQSLLGGPGDVGGLWPLIVANVLAAPLIGMAPLLVQRLKSRGRLILSGISWTLESEVQRAYRHFGIRNFASKTRDGWTVLTGQASW